MTPLSRRKTKLTFLTADVIREKGRYRQVVVEAHPEHLTVRLQGLRTAFSASWGGIYQIAAANAARELVAAKKAAKKQRGGR